MVCTRTPRVLFFTNSHTFTAQHREPLIREFKNRGWCVSGIAPERSGAALALQSLGVPVLCVGFSRAGSHPVRELGVLWAVVQVYRRMKPALVIHATIKPVLYGTIAAWWLRIPVVNLVTGLGYLFTVNSTRVRLMRCAVAILYRLVFLYPRQRVIVQNTDDLQVLSRVSGLPSGLSRLVPGSGVDTLRYMPQDSPEPPQLQVVLIGRMLYDKGVEVFVEAAENLKSRYPAVQFLMVGPHDEENPSGVPVAQLAKWTASGLVEWHGSVEDIRAVYRSASIIVLPSRREGMPKVVLEAAACGLPVVTTNVPGCRDSVIDGKTGYLVPWGDASALSEKIALLIDSPSLRNQMGRNARRLAEERFAAPLIGRQIMDIAMELV